jgi:hypothetical protein
MVVIRFQTEASDRGQGGGFGLASLSGKGIDYILSGVSPARMQKIADEAQEAVESELKAAGWQIMPAEKLADMDEYKSWTKSPDESGQEVKRSLFTDRGRGTNSTSSREMERVFVGGMRPLVGNGVVLGGLTGAPTICRIGKAAGAKVVLFRADVNFSNIHAGQNHIFLGTQQYKSEAALEISYAEMDVYPPDANGTTPARLDTDAPITMHSGFVKDMEGKGMSHTVVADPDIYAKDTVEAIRSIAKGFAGETNK